ncbi:hypothetical protein MMPV_005952 [Pyropia vietnamensis]
MGSFPRWLVGVAITTSFLFTALVPSVAAHSSLIIPKERTYETACRVGGMRSTSMSNCTGPCPTRKLRENYTIMRLRRGRRFPIVYYRNNHKGGFLRLSLVPVDQAMNHTAHRVNAFRTSCWSHGRVWCGRGVCGNDRKRSRYKQMITVPPVFPDGEYVLGFVWYGGGYQQGDYYSCARVRVHGGVRLRPTYRPVLTRTDKKGRCLSTASAIGDCAVEPCTRKQYLRQPIEWANGRRPQLIHAAAINASLGPHPEDPIAQQQQRKKKPARRLTPWQRKLQARRRHLRERRARERARAAKRRQMARAAKRRKAEARRKAARAVQTERVRQRETAHKAAHIEARRRQEEAEARRKQERADPRKAPEETANVPEEAVREPEETANAPEEAANAPEEAASAPEEAVSASAEASERRDKQNARAETDTTQT